MDKNIDFLNLNGYQSYDFPDPEYFFNPMNQYEQGIENAQMRQMK